MQYIPQEEPTWQQLPPTEALPSYQWQPSPSLPPGKPPNRGPGRGGKNAIPVIAGVVVLALLGLSILGASAYVAFQLLPTSANQVQTTPTQNTPTVIPTSTSLATSTVMPTPISTVHLAGPQATVTPAAATTSPTPSATPGRRRFGGHHHRRKSG
jgi:hypothetical protein